MANIIAHRYGVVTLGSRQRLEQMASVTTPPGSDRPPASAVSRIASGAILPAPLPDSSETDSEGLNFAVIWQALRRRKRLALLAGTVVTGATFGSTVWERITAPVYQGNFQMLISDPISSGSGAASGSEGGTVETLARNRTTIDFPSLVETLRSPMVLDPLRSKLGPAGDLLGAAQVSQVAEGVLSVSLIGNKPSEVQEALNSLSNAYLNFAIMQRQRQLNEGLRFLDEQEPKLQITVNQLQGQLAAFRRRYKLINPEAEATDLKAESSGFDSTERELAEERTRLQKLRQGVMSGTLTSSNFSTGSDAGVTVTQSNSDLLAQLQSVEEQLGQARSTYRNDTPRMLSLTALRTRLAGQLRSNQLEALDTALNLNATKASTISAQRRSVDLRFLKQPALIKEYEQIQQRLTVAQENLTSFLTTRSTFQLERAQKAVPWSLLSSPSVGSNPVGPILRDGFIKAILFGVFAGVGAAIIRDRFDHVFRSAAEVRDQLNVPILGHIPYLPFFNGVRDSSRFMIDELDLDSTNENSGDGPAEIGSLKATQVYQRFAYKEAFRNLYTSLRFLNTGDNLRTVGLTSCTPNEGKSLVNVLLAKTIAELGQRVLLIDADMRKPQVHHRLGINNLVGLSTLLAEERQWQQSLVTVPGYDNWWVIPAGLRPPDPTRLLSSDRMQKLMKDIIDSKQFDFILFDTPPVIGLADTALLSQYLDGLMLLVSLDMVDRDLPKDALQRIYAAGAPVLGVVTNAVKEETEVSGLTIYQRYGYSEIVDTKSESYDASGKTSFSFPLRLQNTFRELQNRSQALFRWIDG